jgi:hypothetical protein
MRNKYDNFIFIAKNSHYTQILHRKISRLYLEISQMRQNDARKTPEQYLPFPSAAIAMEGVSKIPLRLASATFWRRVLMEGQCPAQIDDQRLKCSIPRIASQGIRVRKSATCIFASLLLGIPAVAAAQQTASYTYDALGRVVTAQHSGTFNNTTMNVNYDNADNRTSLSISGSSAFRRVIVLPLGGFVIIPLP